MGEQVNSAGIHASGGLLVQILPKAAEEPALVELIEQRCREITGFSQRLAASGDQLEDLLRDVFPDLDPKPLDDAEASQELVFSVLAAVNAAKLHCSYWAGTNSPTCVTRTVARN